VPARMALPGVHDSRGIRCVYGQGSEPGADNAGTTPRNGAAGEALGLKFKVFTDNIEMAKVLATEIRAGNLIEWDKRVWRVLKSHHVHVGGRGGAFMQVEMKDLESGTKRNERLRTEDKIERAFVEQRAMEYLYFDGSSYVFMDKESFEQLTLPADFLEGQAGFLVPNIDVQVNFHNDRPIGVQLPASVTLAIVETEPNLKGATATGSFKPARMETGLTVQVPQFLAEGERIKVNTDTGEYIERA